MTRLIYLNVKISSTPEPSLECIGFPEEMVGYFDPQRIHHELDDPVLDLSEFTREDLDMLLVHRGNCPIQDYTPGYLALMDALFPKSAIEFIGEQERCVQQALESLKRYPVFFNISELGAGKTEMTTAMAQQLGLPILIVSTASIRSVWDSMRYSRYSKVAYHSFSQIRIAKHTDFLIRSGKSFVVSDTYRHLVTQGICLVCDECHHIKNATQQRLAMETLIHPIISSPGRSVVVMLSATPFDKEEHAYHFMRTIGFCNDDPITKLRPKCPPATGLNQILEHCASLNPDATLQCRRTYYYDYEDDPMTRKDAIQLIYDLYCKVLKGTLVNGCKKPELIVQRRIINTFYTLNEDELEMYRDGARLLDQVERGEDRSIGSLMRGCYQTHKAMLRSIASNIQGILSQDCHAKVIVYMTYLDTYTELEKRLTSTGTLIPSEIEMLHGTSSFETRARVIASFNAPNDRLRVLLVGLRVGGTGLNLQDIHGGYTRHSFILPSYHYLEMHQASGRTWRPGSQSDSHIYYTYCEQVQLVRLFDSLVQKGTTVNETVSDVQGHILNASEYESSHFG